MAASEVLKSALRKRFAKEALTEEERKAYNTYIYGKIKESKQRKKERKALEDAGLPPVVKEKKKYNSTYKKMKTEIEELKKKLGEI